MSDRCKTVASVVGIIRRSHCIGGFQCFDTEQYSFAGSGRCSERQVLGCDRIPARLPLLNDIGQSLQGIVLVGILEVIGTTDRCLTRPPIQTPHSKPLRTKQVDDRSC